MFFMVKRIGLLEYSFEQYIHDVMALVKKSVDVDFSFMSFGSHRLSGLEHFDLIFDTISPFNKYVAEMAKLYRLKGTYIINDPFVTSAYNKMVQYDKLAKLGMPIPKTFIVPDKPDTTERVFVRKPLYRDILDNFSFPFVMKPYDGWGTYDIHVIGSRKDLFRVGREKQDRIMLVQEAVFPVDYYRVFVINKKDVYFLKRKPTFIEAKNFDFRDFSVLTPKLRNFITRSSVKICRSIGYDFSTIEWSITEEGKAFIIDVNDAPNVADPKKARRNRTYFPKEAYDWVVDRISGMFVEKIGSA